MKECFIGYLVDLLCQGGVNIDYLEQENYLFLCLCGGFIGGDIEVDGSVFSQFLIVLLMMVLLVFKDIIICVKGELVLKFYIDIMLNLMKIFGVEIVNYYY